MYKGLLIAFLFYTIGLAIAGLCYLTIGHEYIHAPGLHHIITLITFCFGFLSLLVAFIRYISGRRTEVLRGIMLANCLMCLGFALFMGYIIDGTYDNSKLEANTDKISIEESGDTTTMYHDGSPVYLKVKDSVLINFIDSTKIDWNEVERSNK